MTARFPHLLPVFLLEAETCLATLGSALSRLAEELSSPAAWAEAGRAAHTLKGNASMMVLRDIEDVAFAAELQAQAGLSRPSEAVVADLRHCRGELRDLIDSLVADMSAAGRGTATAAVFTASTSDS